MRNINRLKPCNNFVLLLLSIIFFNGCSAVKKINDPDHLLNKNIIKTNLTELKEQETSIIKQKPNKKIIGVFRFHLGIYNLASSGKETRFKRWVKRTIGEEPVLLDTLLTAKSTEQLKLFMHNKGYFKAIVSDSTHYKKQKKANVYYNIQSGNAYTVRTVHYQIADIAVKNIVMSDTTNSVIKKGENYDASVLQRERERITLSLKNNGYYFFNQQYISFSIDTNLQSYQADVYILISKPTIIEQQDSSTVITGLPFQPYVINKVFIQTDYDPISKKEIATHDTLTYDNYFFLTSGKTLLYKPSLLLKHVFIQPGTLFTQQNLEDTYRRFQDLGNFKFINIKYSIPKETSISDNKLNCEILLTPAARQDYKLEAELTNSGGNLGIPLNIVYRNKNIFKGCELLEVKLKGGIEKQLLIADTTLENQTNLPFFNTYEIGPEVSLSIPRFVLPIYPKVYFNPTTTITTAYNYQQRLEYKRALANLSYSFSWKQRIHIRHFIYPAEINFVKVELQPAFKQKLLDLKDPALLKSYDDQLITNGRYTFIYNNQDIFKISSHTYFKFNFEIAGNTIWLANKLQNKKPENGENFTLFTIPFAQYIRPDFDIRYYQVFSQNSQLVYRVAAGIGLAYLNSSAHVMPFEKSFYSGGSNDMRAWKARQLGPGNYSDDQRFEKNGEIKINSNVEFRFDIFRKLKGATFVDAGNIWLVKPDENRPGGGFHSATFLDEIAIGAGLGIRFDFTFFILRLDAAQKLKDPSKPVGERWVYSKNKIQSDTVINFGIGYPF